jgi:thiamine pyrophosphate-dependent acetolactate synthase large subunit-like protein
MATTVSDQLLQRLIEWGVHRVYGYPGDGINGVMGASTCRPRRHCRSSARTREWWDGLKGTLG